VTALVIGVVLDGSGEEGVDEGGLSQPRFTSNLTKSVKFANMGPACEHAP